MKGIVKRFDNKRGYGFIKAEESEKDIFIHYSEIKMDGYKSLQEGDEVEFDFDAEKVKATNLKVVKKNNTQE